MLARLHRLAVEPVPQDAASRARRLAAALAVVTFSAVGVHRLDPALPFPLFEAWALGGALTAALVALLGPGRAAGRRVGALLVAALLLRAGLPAAHNATFPWIELGRARIAEWEDVALLGLVAGLLATASSTTAAQRWTSRAMGLLAAVALGVTLFFPIKSSFQGLADAAPGMTTVPVLAWSAPAEKRWMRAFTTGSGLALFPAHVRDEWALMDIAGGIHQQAAQGAAARGEGTAALTAVRGGVRFGVWRALQAVAAVAHGLRALAFPVVLVVLGASLSRPSLPARVQRPARALLTASLLAVPAANLGALALATLVWLPDDGALRIPALASTVAMLAVVGLAHAATREEAG
ncbi:MAG: hypothetical protein Q8P41_00505 [Pseudomonadota bacterium]|nr:hypothetical protein [Pseudomonadota bacterium]